MKKVFFFLAAGAMGFTACTSEDVVDESVQSNAIGFQNVVTKESRVVNSDNFGAFHVYGYYTKSVEGSADPTVVSVFNGETILKNAAGDAWTYDNTRYWVPGGRYFFYAYSCENMEAPTGTAVFDLGGETTADRALCLNNYVLHNHDLVYAEQEGNAGGGIVGKEQDNEKVSLNFSHILSRVRATFKSDFAPGYQIKVSNVKLVGVRNEGNFAPRPSYAWSSVEYNPAGSQPEVEFTMYVDTENGNKTLDVATAAVPAVGTEGEEGYQAAVAAVDARTAANYVIPFNYTENNVKLVFEIDVMDADGNVVYEQTITGTWKPNWVLGKAYNYVITISGTEAGLEPIEFEVVTDAIDAWGNAADMVPGEEDFKMEFESTAKE